jgi:dsRNA-specific ribonuclease
LSGGFQFELCTGWKDRVLELQSIISTNKVISRKLGAGLELLLHRLNVSPEVEELLLRRPPQVLLQCALFDDTLDDLSHFSLGEGLTSKSADQQHVDLEKKKLGLVQLALMRDTAFHVGAFGLQLMLTQQVYKRFPRSSPNDLHLLRAVAITNDVVAYIMLKNGLHKALFDQNSESVRLFEQEVLTADKLGQSLWDQNGGWFLGIREFQQRTQLVSRPRYPGIAGGRLYGNAKKLPKRLTDELVFSFKTMFGALLLALGLDGAWSCVECLFEELLLLTPDELHREFGECSTLVGY